MEDSRAAEAAAAIYDERRTHPLGPLSVLILQFLSRNLYADELAPTLAHVVIARQGVQRKRVAINVILQIKDAGKSRAGEFRFVPGSVIVLIRHQPRNGTLDAGIVRSAHCEQSNDRPGRLTPCSSLSLSAR